MGWARLRLVRLHAFGHKIDLLEQLEVLRGVFMHGGTLSQRPRVPAHRERKQNDLKIEWWRTWSPPVIACNFSSSLSGTLCRGSVSITPMMWQLLIRAVYLARRVCLFISDDCQMSARTKRPIQWSTDISSWQYHRVNVPAYWPCRSAT